MDLSVALNTMSAGPSGIQTPEINPRSQVLHMMPGPISWPFPPKYCHFTDENLHLSSRLPALEKFFKE